MTLDFSWCKGEPLSVCEQSSDQHLNVVLENYLGSNEIQLEWGKGEQALGEKELGDECRGPGDREEGRNQEMTVGTEEKINRGEVAVPLDEEEGRETWQLFIAFSPQKGKPGLPSGRSGNKPKTFFC